MSHSLCLTLQGCAIHFSVFGPAQDGKWVSVEIKLQPDPSFVGWSFRPVRTMLCGDDFRSLAKYLRGHISRLRHEFSTDLPETLRFLPSNPWMTYEKDFRVTALIGEVKSLTEGRFTLSFMLNAGRAPQALTDTFCGVEALVEVADVIVFCDELEHVANGVPSEEWSGSPQNEPTD